VTLTSPPIIGEPTSWRCTDCNTYWVDRSCLCWMCGHAGEMHEPPFIANMARPQDPTLPLDLAYSHGRGTEAPAE